MKSLPWIIVLIVLVAAVFFVWRAESEAKDLRRQAVKEYVNHRILTNREIERLQVVIDSLEIEKQVSNELFTEFIGDAEAGEQNIALISQRYETTLDSIRGLSVRDLERYLLERATR